jgi:hypothetical protein
MNEIKKTVCRNPWCKSTFEYKDYDLEIVNGEEVPPRFCKKCISFDKELSDGVKWENKHYEGNPFKGDATEVSYKIKNYK